jgi:plastocyanin
MSVVMSIKSDLTLAFLIGGATSCMIYAAVALPGPASITIENFTFKSPALSVPVGTTVTWENDDDIVHTVVAIDGSFRSQALDGEDKFAFKFETPGTYDYFCSLHPRMKGQIVVTP